jgi:putative ABC transport system substrate-binding protein
MRRSGALHLLYAFLLPSCLLLPDSGAAQMTSELRRVGVISVTRPCPPAKPFIDALAGLGWVEGRTISFDCVSVAGRPQDVPVVVAELVARRPELIVAGSTTLLRALKAATSTIPVVSYGSLDPVREGLVQSLSHPGGNITGMAEIGIELDEKRIEILREVVPGLSRLAVVRRAQIDAAIARDMAPIVKEWEQGLERSSSTKGIVYQFFDVAQREDYPRVFADIASGGFGAIFLAPNALAGEAKETVGTVARSSGVPTICDNPLLVEAGVLMSYGPNFTHTLRQTAGYVDKVLRGTKAAELPVQLPTEFDFVINLTTQKALGIAMPPSLIVRATRTIE